jgi:hypothetical protein
VVLAEPFPDADAAEAGPIVQGRAVVSKVASSSSMPSW